MNDLIHNKAETMTSTQLSELLHIKKKEINREIRTMFKDKIDGGKIPPSFDTRGYVVEYHLPELESKMFVAKKDINYLEKITQFWINQTSNKIPQTFSEALLLAAEQTKQIETLEAQKQIDAPMVEFAKVVEGTTAKLSIGAFAKLSGKIGRNNLFKKLREHKILMANNIPYQNFIDSGYFETSETVIKRTSTDMITITTHVTGKVQLWLSKKIGGWL